MSGPGAVLHSCQVQKIFGQNLALKKKSFFKKRLALWLFLTPVRFKINFDKIWLVLNFW